MNHNDDDYDDDYEPTTIYWDLKEDGGMRCYLRFGMLETPRFPHGISLTASFDSEEEIAGFKKDVDAYIKACIESEIEEQILAGKLKRIE